MNVVPESCNYVLLREEGKIILVIYMVEQLPEGIFKNGNKVQVRNNRYRVDRVNILRPNKKKDLCFMQVTLKKVINDTEKHV